MKCGGKGSATHMLVYQMKLTCFKDIFCHLTVHSNIYLCFEHHFQFDINMIIHKLSICLVDSFTRVSSCETKCLAYMILIFCNQQCKRCHARVLTNMYQLAHYIACGCQDKPVKFIFISKIAFLNLCSSFCVCWHKVYDISTVQSFSNHIVLLKIYSINKGRHETRMYSSLGRVVFLPYAHSLAVCLIMANIFLAK